MNPLAIIEKFYVPGTRLYEILVNHSTAVAQKSVEIAESLPMDLDLGWIEKAAMLHDIGIFLTRADDLGCCGTSPYICHGYLGRTLLDEEGLDPGYGLVCERHTGAGLTRQNIVANKLPLPKRDMVPLSIEEKIICVADKYHSKSSGHRDKKFTTSQVIRKLEKINPAHARRFSRWAGQFNLLSRGGV